jgi:nucleotide-binding universal stress UspA family protein
MPENPSDRIVVGVDGSAPSDAAIRWAAREAAMRNVPLTLSYVMTPGVSPWGLGYSMAPLPLDYGELEKEDGQRVLESARRVVEGAIAPGEHVQVHSDLVFATPAPTLVDVTKDAQMIVVGCQGQGAWRRGLFGSVSTALVHHAHCPVAVIHDPDDAPTPTSGPVVVGIDGSPASELATAIAFDEASRRGAELVHYTLGSIPRPPFPDRHGPTFGPRPRKHWPSGSQAGTTATPTWSSTVGWCSISRPAICWKPPSPPNWSWSAATAAVVSPGCCSARSAAPSCTPSTHR